MTEISVGFLGRAVSLLLVGLFFGLPRVNAAGNPDIPIEHIIIIVQENHSFDNYFGTFPGANGIRAGTVLADYPGGPLINKPFPLEVEAVPFDLPHGWTTAKVVWDNGAMDGFLWGEYAQGTDYYGKAIPVPTPNPALVTFKKLNKNSAEYKKLANEKLSMVDGQLVSPHGFADDEDEDAPDVEERNAELRAKEPVPSGSPNPAKRGKYVIDTIGYWDNRTIPNYWEYAEKFTLCDAFFSAMTGPSVPNHLYIVAAQSGALVGDGSIGRRTVAEYSFPSVIQLLGQAGITWKYYSGTRPTGEEEIWKPLPGFRAYSKRLDPGIDLESHLQQTNSFFNDLKAGTLPQVCWLTPAPALSEHSPSNIVDGMWYVTGLINAVMESSYWNTCAILLMWDDYGGFYDHVPPVQIDEFGFGFRVPAMVISPYSLSGKVVHTQYDLTSALKLIETKFGLSPLTARDGMSNSMLECFDFTQTPLPPVIINKGK